MLSHLKLRNFRNYRTTDLDFPRGWTLILGANGQGKSNLLEAIWYLAILRSFRTRLVETLCHWEADTFSIHGRIESPAPDGRTAAVDLCVTHGQQRRLLIDQRPVSMASEFIHQFPCQILVPEDLLLVKGSARDRRRCLDILISQLDPPYVEHLQKWGTALKSRNAILRDADKYGAALQAYDAAIARHGAYVTTRRRAGVERLAACLAATSPRLISGTEPLTLRFVSGLGRPEPAAQTESEVETALRESLARGYAKDRAEGRTRWGPHRDDFAVGRGDRLLAEFGSEGEARIACLALRLASLELIRQDAARSGEIVVLVDDVVGELDADRRRTFFQMIAPGDQVILAATTRFPELQDRLAATWSVTAGVLCPLHG